ncbi:hypothetical protein Taro_027161 [Colocasia esculenta]|uniref:Uncharacterized protein n=1 Tax=Colocasia esculenta TaxID=4460 RepID=A0A843VD93_COLES|nr:hypothetical protein [Colocasia esculenta]
MRRQSLSHSERDGGSVVNRSKNAAYRAVAFSGPVPESEREKDRPWIAGLELKVQRLEFGQAFSPRVPLLLGLFSMSSNPQQRIRASHGEIGVYLSIPWYNQLFDHVGIHGQRRLTEALNKDSLVRQKEYPTKSLSKSREKSIFFNWKVLLELKKLPRLWEIICASVRIGFGAEEQHLFGLAEEGFIAKLDHLRGGDTCGFAFMNATLWSIAIRWHSAVVATGFPVATRSRRIVVSRSLERAPDPSRLANVTDTWPVVKSSRSGRIATTDPVAMKSRQVQGYSSLYARC